MSRRDLIRARRATTPTARRRAGPLPRQLEPTSIQLTYYAELKPLLTAMRKAVERHVVGRLPELVERAGVRGDGPADDDTDYGALVSEMVEGAKDEVEREVARSKVAEVAKNIAKRTSSFGRAELARQFKAGLGIDIMTLEPWLPQKIAGFTAENVSLIKSIPQQFFAQVEAEVIKGVRAGRRHERLAESIQERFSVSESRARLIARDQVNKFNGELNLARQADLGITHFVWRTVGDNRVREKHEHLNGKKFTHQHGADGLFPGQDIQCLPGNSTLSLAPGVVKLYRRRYSGQLTEIVTDTGETLRATPNHPVLSGRGWIPIHLLNVGDDVVKAGLEGVDFSIADPERRDPSFEEFFSALLPLGVAKRVRASGGWFHGDATDEEIDVVDVNWGLGDELDPSLSQRFCEDALALADDPHLALGPVFKLFDGSALAESRAVRGFCKAYTLFGRGGLHSLDHRCAATAWLDAIADQARTNGLARHAELLGQLLHAHAGKEESGNFVSRVLFGVVCRAVVQPSGLYAAFSEPPAEQVAVDRERAGRLGDRHASTKHACRVVEKRVREFQAGHVFNLETACGWYAAQSLIIHNCRCTAEPDIDGAMEALANS